MNCNELYIDLLKKSLTYSLFDREYYKIDDIGYGNFSNPDLIKELNNITTQLGQGLKLVLETPVHDSHVRMGDNWPAQAYTMIGLNRLNNLQFCVEDVLKNQIEGDLVETGVWRGGSCMLMKGILRVNNNIEKNVWVVDSFEGIPEPNLEKYPEDKEETMHTADYLRVSLESVKSNFQRFGLLDEKVKFIKGRFSDSLPNAPIKSISVLRLDGDTYESTIDCLNYLYGKLNIGFILYLL